MMNEKEIREQIKKLEDENAKDTTSGTYTFNGGAIYAYKEVLRENE